MNRNFALACLACAAGLTAPEPGYAQPPAAAPIVAISDIHGAYDAFVDVLSAAGLIDATLAWTGGNARLVIVGDVLDRGARSRDALELVMQLEQRAAAAGGAVHLVLGNHEIMNLVGELSYVSPDEFAAFAADESRETREAALQRFRARRSGVPDAVLAADFNERHPPGFFGHRAAFSTAGTLGRWLLDRPVVLVLEGTAFVHGGLFGNAGSASAEELNAAYAQALRDYLHAFDTLVEAEALHSEDAFADRPGLARRALTEAPALGAAAQRLADLTGSRLFGADSVYWYRGTAACSPAIEAARVDSALRALGAERIVIGHTPTVPRRVLARFDGRVLRADTGMLTERFGGEPAAIVIRGSDVHAVYRDSSAPPEPQAVNVAAFAAGLGDEELERGLATAPIGARTGGTNGVQYLQLAAEGRALPAVFYPSEADPAAPLAELAAYRLDSMLELGLVPAAVVREIDGVRGTVQADVREWPDERARVDGGQQGAEWCPLRDQFALMYVFDALAGSPPRTVDELRYMPSSWQLALTGNRDAFGAGRSIPDHLRDVPIDVPPVVIERLAALTPASLEAALGEALDEDRRGAILSRRDRLLERLARN